MELASTIAWYGLMITIPVSAFVLGVAGYRILQAKFFIATGAAVLLITVMLLASMSLGVGLVLVGYIALSALGAFIARLFFEKANLSETPHEKTKAALSKGSFVITLALGLVWLAMLMIPSFEQLLFSILTALHLDPRNSWANPYTLLLFAAFILFVLGTVSLLMNKRLGKPFLLSTLSTMISSLMVVGLCLMLLVASMF